MPTAADALPHGPLERRPAEVEPGGPPEHRPAEIPPQEPPERRPAEIPPQGTPERRPAEIRQHGTPGRRVARRAPALLGALGLAALPVLLLVVACAAVSTPGLVEASHARLPGWLLGVLPRGVGIDRTTLALLEAAMVGAWLLAIAAGRRLSWRAVLGAIVVLDIVALLAPPLLSTDVFNYIDGGRLFALHGINPYLHGPAIAPLDPAFQWTGPRWIHTPTVYGPLFTLLAGALAPLGVAGGLWAFKLLAALALLGITLCVAAIVRARGGNPVRAALIVGANPVLVLWGVAGAHNDLLMAFGLTAGVLAHTRGRAATGAAAVVAAAAVKASAVVVAPFLVLGAERRVRAAFAALASGGALLLLSLALWGTAPLGVGGVLASHAWVGELGSVPGFAATRLGLAAPGAGARTVLDVVSVLAVVACLVWTFRRREAWLAAAALAALAVLCLSTAFYPWYLALALPLAAAAPGVAAPAASIAVTVLVMLMRTGHWLFGWQVVLHHAHVLAR